MARRLWLVMVLVLLVGPAASFAATINIGILSFDVLIPGDPVAGIAGINVFSVANYTNNAFGCNPVDPCDFPVSDSLTFFNSVLTLITPGGPDTIPLGDIDAGGLGSSPEFLGDLVFSSAIFTATLSQTSFHLVDGTLFTAASSAFSAVLSPSLGSTLTPGTDLVLLTVSEPQAPTVPEPSSVLLLGCGLAGLIGVKTRSRRNQDPKLVSAGVTR